MSYDMNDIKGKIDSLAMRMYAKGYTDGRNTLTKELENIIDRVGNVNVFENDDNHLTYLDFYYAVKDLVEKEKK